LLFFFWWRLTDVSEDEDTIAIVSSLSGISTCSNAAGVGAETCSSCWVTGMNSILSFVDFSVSWTAEASS